jgi:multidrug efflux pump subunit AcrA (membrane-fusion protein)
VAKPAPSPAAAGMTPAQIKAQIAFSKKRKAYLDNKYKRQEKIKAAQEARQAKIKAAQDARQKREAERQKAKEAQKQMEAQREADRQNKIKAQQEERERMEEEKARQAQVEAQKRQQAQQQAQLEAQLEAQRQAVRKQLEDGVETMYEEAVRLYDQGQYITAAGRFKDVLDIMPSYKQAERYMNQARSKALSAVSNVHPAYVPVPEPVPAPVPFVAPAPAITPTPAKPVPIAAPAPASNLAPADDASQGSVTVGPVTIESSTPVSRQEQVSKALDLFDTNAQ